MALVSTSHGAGPWRPVIVSGGFAGLTAFAFGAAIMWDPRIILPLLGLATIVFLQSFGWRMLGILLIASTFVTRMRFDFVGMRILPEHMVIVACLVALLVGGRGRAVGEAVMDRAVLLFGIFVAWNGFVSLLRSPAPAESLQIVGWLALDWLLLVVIISSTNDPYYVARHGMRFLGWAAAAAVTLWVAAVGGLTPSGVQYESAYDAPAAYGLSHESNILAATLALWAFVVLTIPRRSVARGRVPVLILTGVAIALSLTRAALVGLVAGMLLWALLQGRIGLRLVWRVAAMATVAVVVLVAVAPTVAAPIIRKNQDLLDFGSGAGLLRVNASLTAINDMNGVDWIVGLGSNSYGQRHLDPTRPDSRIPGYLGNLPLQVVYDSGLVGAALLIGMLATVVPRRRHSAARALGAVTVYLACAIATSPFWFGTTWIMMGMAVISRRRKASEARRNVEYRRNLAVGTTAGVVGLDVERRGPSKP